MCCEEKLVPVSESRLCIMGSKYCPLANFAVRAHSREKLAIAAGGRCSSWKVSMFVREV